MYSNRNRSRKSTIAFIIVLSFVVMIGLLPITAFAAEYDMSLRPGGLDWVDLQNGMIIDRFAPADPTGTGNFNTFLQIQKHGIEMGYNTDAKKQFDEGASSNFNKAILLSQVPYVTIDNVIYREFQLDINQNTGGDNNLLSMDRFQVWLTTNPAITDYATNTWSFPGGTAQKVYDMGGHSIILDYDANAGSGKRDYRFLIEQSLFSTSYTNPYVVLFIQHGATYPANDGFEEWGVRIEDKGCLKITKNWLGYPQGFDNFPESVTGTVTGANGYNEPFTLTALGNWTTTICDLPLGSYTVTENDIPGWSTALVPVSGTVNVVKGDASQAVEVVINNTLDLGCLQINKYWEEEYADYVPTSVAINVTGPDQYDEDFDLLASEGWTKMICDLIPGEYTVSEYDVPGWSTTLDPTSGAVTVVAGTSAAAVTVDIWNKFDLGCLEINKYWEEAYEDYAPTSVAIRVTGPDQYDEDINLLATEDWTLMLCDLIPGEYTVMEYDVPGWSTTLDPTSGAVTVVAGTSAAAVTVDIWNTFDLGCLKVVKTWDNDEMAPEEVIVHVYSDEAMLDQVGTITLSAIDWEGYLCDLVPGTYYVAEEPVDGYTTTYPNGNSATVIAGDEENAVVIEIENELDLGCLEINKYWEEAYEDYAPTSVAIRVTGPDQYDEDFNLLATEDWTLMLCDLIPGEYSVMEYDVPGWSTTLDPTSGAVTVVAGTSAAAVTVDIWNTFDLGCLKVVKTWDNDEMAPEEVIVHVYSDEAMLDQVGTITLSAIDWEGYLCDLVPGTYYVAEEPVVGYDTYYPNGNSATVIAGDEENAVVIEIINTLMMNDETAWAFGGPDAIPFNDPLIGLTNWGWTNGPIAKGTSLEMDLYAAAGQNDLSKGTLVGKVTVDFDSDGHVSVVYSLFPGVKMTEAHVWIGDAYLPLTKGKAKVFTNAPGSFNFSKYDKDGDEYTVDINKTFDGPIYIAAHAVVQYPCCYDSGQDPIYDIDALYTQQTMLTMTIQLESLLAPEELGEPEALPPEEPEFLPPPEEVKKIPPGLLKKER